jgi:hypothetical protein
MEEEAELQRQWEEELEKRALKRQDRDKLREIERRRRYYIRMNKLNPSGKQPTLRKPKELKLFLVSSWALDWLHLIGIGFILASNT